VTYDPNGNITKYLRHGDIAANVVMDSLTYKYNVDASGDLVNNRLRQVRDTVADARYVNVDLDIQTNVDNYGYDAIGNLTSDVKEGITSVLWTVYGKIKEINKTTSAVTGTVQKISYTYDASGNRLSKTVTKVGTANDVTTWYVRDASGNIMGIYEAVSETPNVAATAVFLVEHDLYGSSRLGVVSRNVNIDTALKNSGLSVGLQNLNSSLSVLGRGLKNYELSNHLGNVLVTISDKKLGVSANGTTIDYYTADVVTANDYYPFGMMQPGRKFEQTSGKNYRFSINGQEKEKDLNENITTALYWEYDSRIGRRWNLDPVPKFGESEYLCFGGNPILLSDPSGDQPDSPDKNGGKNYDLSAQMQASCINFLAARAAFFVYVARAERKEYAWDLNNGYREAAKAYSATRYKNDNVATLGISQEAFTKVVSSYYMDFERAFNYAADETMEKLNFIYYNKYSTARNLFKPNLTVSESYDAIDQSMNMLDDMTSEALTIANHWEDVLNKCFVFANLWACSGIGSGVGFSNVTASGLQKARAPSKTTPQMPAGKVGIEARTLIRETKGGTNIYETNGGFNQATSDFNSMKLSDVRTINTQYGSGQSGTLPNGNTVILRPGSSDGRATLEIQRTTANGSMRKVEETRYNQ
jgi:YD repeat-containing protein